MLWGGGGYGDDLTVDLPNAAGSPDEFAPRSSHNTGFDILDASGTSYTPGFNFVVTEHEPWS